jgi:hypothetical protein
VTWSYSGNPAASDLDAVRFYVGDTNSARELLQDEEINFTLTEHSVVRMAAAVCADAIAAKFAREADQKVGDISKALSQVSEAFERLASRLRRESSKRAAPVFPASSRDWKETQLEDTDLVQPQFEVGQMDNPWAVQLNNQLDLVAWRGW